MPQQVLTDLKTRLETSRDRIRDLAEQLAAERQRRDSLIVDAVDQGGAQRAVANWGGISQSRVTAIIVDSQPDAVLPR